MEGKSLAWVMIGGMLGAAARYLVGGWAQRRYGATFPWGTLIINLSGCFLLGLFQGVRLEGRYALPTFLTPAFGIGFVGAYTTFSTFAIETMFLVEERSMMLAAGNVVVSVVLGLLIAAIGLTLGRRL